MLTRTSVDWADRMVATDSSNGVLKSSSHPASGNSTASRPANRLALRVLANGVDGGDARLTTLTCTAPVAGAGGLLCGLLDTPSESHSVNQLPQRHRQPSATASSSTKCHSGQRS